MNDLARRIQRVYLTLLLGNTLAASFIWGINTLFLLDAGLSNLEAFAANAFFTAGMMIFEIPTGRHRRHCRPPGLLSPRNAHALGRDAPLLLPVGVQRPVLAVGDRLDAARAGVHVLLRRSRGMACRRAELRGLRGWARGRARARADDLRRCDAGRVGRRWSDRPGDDPRRAVPAAGRGAPRDVRRRLGAHARPRLHARPVGGPGEGRQARLLVLARVRPRKPAGALDDARGALLRRESASTPSTRSSRTFSSCGATRRRTPSRGSRPRSSRARRSPAATRRRGSARSSTSERARSFSRRSRAAASSSCSGSRASSGPPSRCSSGGGSSSPRPCRSGRRT